MGKKPKFYNYDDSNYESNDKFDNFNCAKIIDEDEEEEISLEKEEAIIKTLDSDLVKYFGDAKIINRKKLNNNNFKKSRKQDFTIGQKVKINNNFGKIIFGPYEVGNKFMCEIELENGNIISEDINNIK